ncbi:ribonuclease III [Kineococcus endophyticus]|uniref:ribonuclease III n=1 Tax=Kineococcus endophyticus TaxID=1181883 RepID=UPI003F5AB84B
MTAQQAPAVTPGDVRDVARLTAALGVEVDAELLLLAMTHRSYAYEHGGLPTNERLEFLGDAVLGLVVTHELYARFADVSEGRLAKLRAAVVNSRALADIARGLDLGAHVRLGKGELGTGGRDKNSILADTMEAVIGATYLSVGMEGAREFVLRLTSPLMDSSERLGAGTDWKTALQELTAAEGLGVPSYAISESGPDHAKNFTADAVVGGTALGNGEGRSKKEAEQKAASAAVEALRAATAAAAVRASS